MLLPYRGYFYYLMDSIFHSGIRHLPGHLVIPFLLEWNILYGEPRVSKQKLQHHVSGGACEQDVSWSEHAKFTENWTFVNSQQLSIIGKKSQLESQSHFTNNFGFRHFWHQWPLLCKLLGWIEGKGCRRRVKEYEEILFWESQLPFKVDT